MPDRRSHVPTADDRVVMAGLSWDDFEAQLAVRGDRAGPRMAYLDGVLEIMSPSKDHERIKSYIGRLIETYALERDIDLSRTAGGRSRGSRRKPGSSPTSATSWATRIGTRRTSPWR